VLVQVQAFLAQAQAQAQAQVMETELELHVDFYQSKLGTRLGLWKPRVHTSYKVEYPLWILSMRIGQCGKCLAWVTIRYFEELVVWMVTFIWVNCHLYRLRVNAILQLQVYF
jgi:hypothetical protein